MALDIFWVFTGLVCLYWGAEWLVKGASSLALRFGISSLVVGLTVVAFGTSVPELLVSLQANSPALFDYFLRSLGFLGGESLAPHGDIALGNVVGSNIFNIGLILGTAACIAPIRIHLQLVRREIPILMLASCLFVWMLSDFTLSRWEGVILTLGIIGYTIFSIFTENRKRQQPQEKKGTQEKEKLEQSPLIAPIGLLLLGMGVLIFGADRLVSHGEHLARLCGVPEVVISLTLFALGTSLPELATTIVASCKGEGDMATGNAIGSCIFNIFAVMGVTALVAPIQAWHLNWTDLGVMLLLVFLVLPMMCTRFTLSRLEGSLLVFLSLVYAGITVFLERC